jgi:hypothetical protein
MRVLRGGDDCVVTDGDPGEVLRLEGGGGYMVIRHKSIEEETHTGRSSPKIRKSGDFLAESR